MVRAGVVAVTVVNKWTDDDCVIAVLLNGSTFCNEYVAMHIICLMPSIECVGEL